MGIASLYNVPGNSAELATWSLAHAAHHHDIVQTIYRLTTISLQTFLLDPFDPNDMQGWLYQHQQMHKEMDALLGIAGFDLTTVKWKDAGERAGWIELNATEHVA